MDDVRSDIRGERLCEPSHEEMFAGAWPGNNTIFVRAGSLEISAPFAVSMNGGSFQEITNHSGTDFLSITRFSECGEITHVEFQWR